MDFLKWQPTTWGKSVFKVDIHFQSNKNHFVISVISRRAARWVVDKRQLRRCIMFESPFEIFSDFAIVGFQPETGYMVAVKYKLRMK